MKLPPASLVSMLVFFLVAAACVGGAAEPASDVGVTPRSGPVQSPEGEPQPPAAATPAAAVPIVFLPEVKSLEHLSADVVVPPLPDSFAPPRDDAALAALVRSTLSGFEGEYSVVVRKLEDGRSASLNAGRVYYAASLFKLALLLDIRDGIPFGVPLNSVVAHKSGNFTDASHDVALVWGPPGPHTSAELSDRSWDSEPIRAVSRAIWDYFAVHP